MEKKKKNHQLHSTSRELSFAFTVSPEQKSISVLGKKVEVAREERLVKKRAERKRP